MSLKPKTSRRLALAGVLLVLAVGAFVSLVFVRQWQRERAARTARAEGMAFYEKHAYTQASEQLYKSLRANPSDVEAWRAFGDCWEHDEQPELRNLPAAINAYSRVYDLDPADRATALKLLSLYNRVGQFQEAKTLAARLQPARLADAGPETFDVLREEATARAGLKQFDDRFGEVTDRMVALRPDDFTANLLRAGYLRENKRGPDALTLVSNAVRQHPNSRPLKLLLALVTAQESPSADPTELFNAACSTAGLDPQTGAVVVPVEYRDKDFIFRLVSLFDAWSRFAHSESILRAAAAAPDADPEVLRLSVRRSWQMGRNADVASRLEGIDTSAGGAHADLLAFRAMALHDLGRTADAQQVASALKLRSDYRASAWTKAFEVVPDMSSAAAVTPTEAVKKLRAALKESPGEPAISMLLGQTLASLGRFEEAQEAWKDAAVAAPGWAAPYVECSRALLNEGRADEAMAMARLAMQTFPSNVSANVAFLNAQSALIERGGAPAGNPREMAQRLDDAARQVDAVTDPAARRSLAASIAPARAILAARAGRADEARAIIRAVIATPGEPDQTLLRRLAMLSAREKLGVEEECLARADQGRVPTASSALGRAYTLLESGRPAEGMAILKSGLEGSTGRERLDWARAQAEFLDATGDAAALDAWKALCDANPDELSLQLAALRARSSAGDLAFVDRLTERVNRLSNVEETRPLAVTRLARARALLSGQPGSKARDEAVSILRALTLESGDGYDVRSLLVAALLLDVPERGIKPDTLGALEQLRAMLQIAPDKALVSLQIGTVLQQQREFDRAREELQKVAAAPDARPEIRQRAIDLLIAQADFAGAVGPFRSLLESLGDRAEPAQWIRLASVHRALRQDALALAIYKQLAANLPDDPDQVAQIADGIALDGDQAQAEKALKHLDALKLEPGRRELLLARYWDRRSDPKRAVDYFEQAIAAAPDRPETWTRYAQFCAAHAELDKADDLVKRGLAKNPANADLKVVQQQLAVRRSDRVDVNMSELVDAMKGDPAYKDKAEVVRVVEEMRRDGRLAEVAGIDEMRAKFPREMAVQTLAIRLYTRLAPPRLDLAAAAVKESMQSFPTAAEPASLASAIFRDRGDWAEMLKAAQAWQQLTRSRESELSVAEAYLNLNQTRQALDALHPHLDAAIKEPSATTSVVTLGLQARALAASGRASEAMDLLRPVLKDVPALRTRVAIPVAVTYVRPDSESVAWLQIVEPLVPEDDAEGRLTLAAGWSALASRAKPARADLYDRALDALRPLTQKSGAAAAPAHEAVAGVLRQRNDATGAAESYRRALAADPQRVPSLVGLSALLIASGGEPSEAVSLAERAATIAGPRDAVSQRLLGRAVAYQAARLDAAGKSADAGVAYRRAADVFRSLVAADPTDTESEIELAQVSDIVGDYATSIASYERALTSTTLSAQGRAGLQNNLAYALLKSGKGAASLDRARSLAADAVAASEVAAFLDTLGCIEAARGDRAAAIKAFSRALEIDRSMNGSRIELAAILADRGTAEEKARAKDLLDGAAKAGTLTAEQRQRLDQVRAGLEKPK